jgi:hypothetical protein
MLRPDLTSTTSEGSASPGAAGDAMAPTGGRAPKSLIQILGTADKRVLSQIGCWSVTRVK